jgi:hypothetical protein
VRSPKGPGPADSGQLSGLWRVFARWAARSLIPLRKARQRGAQKEIDMALRFVLFDGAHSRPFEVPDVPSALAVAERIVGPGDWAVTTHADGTLGWSRGCVRLCSVSSLPREAS